MLQARLLSLAALAVGLSATSLSAASVGKVFKDWEVACDNAGNCEALGFQSYEARTPGQFVQLTIKAGGNARPELAFSGSDMNEAGATLLDAPTEYAGKHLVEQFLAIASKATTATFANGDKRASFSLAGLAAALLAIDEAQGRIGTVTALIRRGPKPASTVPAARPLPKLKPVSTSNLNSADEKVLKSLGRRLKLSDGKECPRIAESPMATTAKYGGCRRACLWCNFIAKVSHTILPAGSGS